MIEEICSINNIYQSIATLRTRIKATLKTTSALARRSIPRNCFHFHNRLYNPNDYVGLPYILLPPLNFSSRHQELESAPNASAFYKRWKLYKNQYTCLPVSELQVGRKDKSCVLCHMDFYWQLSRKYVPRGEEYSAEECIFL